MRQSRFITKYSDSSAGIDLDCDGMIHHPDYRRKAKLLIYIWCKGRLAVKIGGYGIWDS